MKKRINYFHRHASSRRSQAALEFLSTYTWAFIVITVTIGALYYSGIFDFGKYLPQKCSFPLQFKCLDFGLDSSQARIKLINNLGEDIKIDSISVYNDASPSVSCTPPPTPFDWIHSTELDLAFTSCSVGGYLANSRIELKILMMYHSVNTPSNPSHIINGKVYGKIIS